MKTKKSLRKTKKSLRKIKKWGNSWVIVLSPSDVKDFKMNEGDIADISDVIILDKKLGELKNEQ